MNNSSSTSSSLAPLDRSSWKRVRLGKIGTFAKGAGISRAESHTGTLPAVRYGELYTEHNDYVRSYCSFISEEVASHSYKTKRGDILFTCSGETAEDIGKAVAVLDDGVYAGGDLLVFSLKEEGDPIFWGTLLNTPPVQIQKSNFSHGATIIHIGESDLSKVEVQFPPLPVQRRIASSLSAVDGHLASLEELVSKYEAIKKSTVSLLLRPQPTWQTKPLRELCEVCSTRRVHESDWTDVGVPFYRARELVALHEGRTIEPLHISEELYRECVASSGKIQAGDLLVTGVGSIGVPYLVKESDHFYFKDGNIIWFKNKGLLDPQYFLYAFRSDFIQDQIREMACVGTVGSYTITNGKKTLIHLPPLSEQRRIVTALSSLDGVLASLAAEREKLASLKRGLLRHFFG